MKNKQILLLTSCIPVGILVAITYYLFETAVRHSTDYVWNTLFNSDTTRYMVVPLCIGLGLLFFGAQHWLAPESEKGESHGLGGDAIKPTVTNGAIILSVGFLSLLAGASLGPEAILVPTSMVIGGYLGVKLFKKNPQAVKVLGAAAIMALMAAFFHSFFIGILSIFLVTKEAKVKISASLLVVAIIASASSTLMLKLIDPTNSYFNFPDMNWRVLVLDVLVGAVLVAAGYAATFALKYGHTAVVYIKQTAKLTRWWQLALLSGAGLSVFYLFGGPLVQFTGNQSIAPLESQSVSLGVMGVLGILVFKLAAIAWSKGMGYRGGLIFPMIFVASSLTVIAQLLVNDISFGVGIVAATVGILAAEKKAKILL